MSKKVSKKKFYQQEWYKDFAIHFGYICGLLTIVGLIYGIVSYHQTVAPVINKEKLNKEISILTIEKETLSSEKEKLIEQKQLLEEEKKNLVKKNEELENENKDNNDILKDLEYETYLVNTELIMGSIVNSAIQDYTSYNKTERNQKKEALEELNSLLTAENITKSEKEAIHVLIAFVNENIDKDSTYKDLLDYYMYVIQNYKKNETIKS